MLEAAVIGIREGLEAALVVGILLAYLQRVGTPHRSRYVFWGLVAAIGGSILAAGAFVRFGLDPENEVLEGVLFMVAAGFVATMVVWMWRTGRSMRAALERQAAQIMGAPGSAGEGRAGIGLAAFTFVMVFREGIETVLFLGALSMAIRGNPLNNAIGGTFGILLAVGFGVLLFKGTLRINLHRFFRLTGAVLLALVLKLVANGLHEFAEVGVLRLGEKALAVIGFLTRESTTLVILMAFLVVPAMVMVTETWRARPQDLDDEPGPARRKRIATARSGRRWAGAAAGLALGISLALTASLAASAARGREPPLVAVPAPGGHIHIPLAGIVRGRLYKYSYTEDGTTVRFFVIRRGDDSLAVALDACGICPPKGYFLDGDVVICRNCDAPINLDTIGQGGGCNPVPVRFETDGRTVGIQVADLLAQGLPRFGGR